MIPVNLQTGLKNRLEEVLKEVRLKSPDDKEVRVNVYEQHVPQSESDDELSLYPYVLIKLVDGEVENETSPHVIKVLFVVGVFDESYDNQGYKDVVLILQKLIAALEKSPVIDKKFVMRYPLRWVVHEEDVYPFYFGGVETTWETNANMVENIGGVLHG